MANHRRDRIVASFRSFLCDKKFVDNSMDHKTFEYQSVELLDNPALLQRCFYPTIALDSSTSAPIWGTARRAIAIRMAKLPQDL